MEQDDHLTLLNVATDDFHNFLPMEVQLQVEKWHLLDVQARKKLYEHVIAVGKEEPVLDHDLKEDFENDTDGQVIKLFTN